MTNLDETTLHQKTLDTAANATVTQWKTALTPSLRLLAASEQGRQTGKLELRPRPHPRLAIMLWNYGHIHSIILSVRTTASIVLQSMEKTKAFSRGASILIPEVADSTTCMRITCPTKRKLSGGMWCRAAEVSVEAMLQCRRVFTLTRDLFLSHVIVVELTGSVIRCTVTCESLTCASYVCFSNMCPIFAHGSAFRTCESGLHVNILSIQTYHTTLCFVFLTSFEKYHTTSIQQETATMADNEAQKLTEAVDDAIQTLSSVETSDDSDKPIDGVVWDVSQPSTVTCLRH
jgi:hypothetical protein